MRIGWWIIVIAVVAFSLLPTWYELSQKKNLHPSRSFELVHNYITDYNFYLSRIRQGYEGRLTAVERYTSEPHGGSLIQELYIVIGQASRFIPDASFAVPLAYHVSRIVFGIAFVGTVAWIAQTLFPSKLWSLIAFFSAVTACGWPVFVRLPEGIRVGAYMPWWTALDTMQRIAFMPHIVLGQTLILFLTVVGGNPEIVSKKKNAVFLGAMGLLLGFIFPPGLLFVLAVYGVLSAMEIIVEKKKSAAAGRLIVGVLAIISILYYAKMLTVYPWKRLVEFDQINPTDFSFITYMKALGPVLIFGLLGAIAVFVKKSRSWYPVAVWAVVSVGLVLFFRFVPLQHPLRFTEMAVFVPLGLLTSYLLCTLISYAHKKKMAGLGVAVMFVQIACIILGAVTMYDSWLWQKDFLSQKVYAGWPLVSKDNYIVYPVSGFILAIDNLSWRAGRGAIVLSDGVAGNYIPARTGQRVYVGHDGTVKKEEKIDLARLFFSGKYPAKDAYAWIRREGITHVFWGPQEKEYGVVDIAGVYPFLRQIYENSDAVIYEVQ